jgi:hypothetical protein
VSLTGDGINDAGVKAADIASRRQRLDVAKETLILSCWIIISRPSWKRCEKAG